MPTTSGLRIPRARPSIITLPEATKWLSPEAVLITEEELSSQGLL